MLNPPRRKPKGAGPSVDEDSFLTMRDEIMTLKKNAAKDRQKKKECGCILYAGASSCSCFCSCS